MDLWQWRELNGPTPCAGHLDIFCADNDGQVGWSETRTRAEYAARNICKTCPVLNLCAEAAIVTINGRRYIEPGIWAGKTQTERCRQHSLPAVPGTGTKYTNRVGRKRNDNNDRI